MADGDIAQAMYEMDSRSTSTTLRGKRFKLHIQQVRLAWFGFDSGLKFPKPWADIACQELGYGFKAGGIAMW
jgi:hypothetical protein